ncbi:peptidase U32 family protein [Geosporobacter ferrireducens]|uniref:Peptidase U32 n=1 Tax=Geosporobacter ferrireducens TaxID=1424294 RepID=A0A1D8GPR9_9FIRM|nr:U32 family peptidase [Geosporobacter ferrireducens]AOT72868.1 peptidase U32 [Geosporobacter ferrireducens]MTI55273.1 U32 family peptidase [Geosporobacter ferrireducens]
MDKVELLAPAGDLERLKMAIIYGADAVYIGGQQFGLRASARNFSFEDMEKGIEFAHERGKKVYVTLNIIPHNEDLQELPAYLQKLSAMKIDALILSDPGTLMYVQEHAPNLEIHLSTQANNTNYMSAVFWHKQGIKRVILARELSLEEIKEIHDKIPQDLELEAFVHGAMCISYSGRCLLSNYMANRDANRGECAHPCRWKYYLVEEKRPGEYFPVVEDEKGTYFYNSKDLCMIEHIPELIQSGLSSLKIEGRMKSVYYVATIVGAYRRALDTYYQIGDAYVYKPEWLEEIKKASHRDFTTGFYFNKPDENEQVYENSSYIREYDFVGLVLDYDPETRIATIEQRNRIFQGDVIEVIGPDIDMFTQTVDKLWNNKDEEIEVAPHPQQIIKVQMAQPVGQYYILRKDRKDDSVE